MGGVGVCVGRGRWFLTFCSWNVTPWSHCCPESCADCCGHQAAAVDVTPSGHHLSVCWIWGSPEHTTLGHQKRYVYIYCWFSWSAFDWLIRFTLYLTWQQSRNAEFGIDWWFCEACWSFWAEVTRVVLVCRVLFQFVIYLNPFLMRPHRHGLFKRNSVNQFLLSAFIYSHLFAKCLLFLMLYCHTHYPCIDTMLYSVSQSNSIYVCHVCIVYLKPTAISLLWTVLLFLLHVLLNHNARKYMITHTYTSAMCR